jgi:hypothetical protein
MTLTINEPPFKEGSKVFNGWQPKTSMKIWKLGIFDMSTSRLLFLACIVGLVRPSLGESKVKGKLNVDGEGYVCMKPYSVSLDFEYEGSSAVSPTGAIYDVRELVRECLDGLNLRLLDRKSVV